MRVLTHRVLPKEARAVKKDLQAITAKVRAGDALNLGDGGKAVAALQRQLTSAGVYTGQVTGSFDAATAAAVVALQQARHLDPSGVVGGKTLKALKSTALFVKDGFGTVARQGQSGKDVFAAERKLQQLGFDPGTVDGVYDAATAAAVKRYRAADPEVRNTGRGIGQQFAQELAKASRAYDHAPWRKRTVGPVKRHDRLDALTAKAAARGGGLGVGAKGRAVFNVERHLQAAGYALGATNRSFGPRTAAAVTAFQKASKLPETGVVDARTWSKLKDTLFAAKSATSPAQRVGERDGWVKKTEQKLKALGFSPGKIDGRFDQATARAVKRFQQRHHLGRSGAVGGGTMKAIQKALKARSGGKILQVARRFLGLHERGLNGNPFSAALGRPAEAWCADFVSYCAKKAGLSLNTASAQGVADFLESKGTWKGRHDPRPGDALTFRWDGSHGWADHVGLVEKVFIKNGRKYVQTIEGNSSDMVRRKVYAANDPVINGFGRIK